uniref:Uncharacterized protein n=1 Tax=Arundo donax TaxID=35708 RepID=A0A0A9BB16_ARUDO
MLSFNSIFNRSFKWCPSKPIIGDPSNIFLAFRRVSLQHFFYTASP